MPNKKPTAYLQHHIAILRIIFGLMWAINAAFKWQASFRNGFLDQIQSAASGQPHWLQGWFSFWSSFMSHDPHLFAYLIAITESLIALALIFGLARRLTYLLAALFSLLVWAIPEGFGGPYSAASTDVGAGIVYAVVFFSLYGLDRVAAQSSWALDTLIIRRLPWWAIIANP